MLKELYIQHLAPNNAFHLLGHLKVYPPTSTMAMGRLFSKIV